MELKYHFNSKNAKKYSNISVIFGVTDSKNKLEQLSKKYGPKFAKNDNVGYLRNFRKVSLGMTLWPINELQMPTDLLVIQLPSFHKMNVDSLVYVEIYFSLIAQFMGFKIVFYAHIPEHVGKFWCSFMRIYNNLELSPK